MILIESLLTLLLALSITGSPIEVRNSTITLPLTMRLNFSNGTIDLVQHDKARVAAFKDYNTYGRAESTSTLQSGLEGKYTASLRVGSPPKTYNVLVDTGSALTWIGARSSYGGTGVDTGQRVGLDYGIPGGPAASFSGTIFRDTVTLGGLTIPNYDLAVASSTSGNINYDGVLGLGPQDLTVNTLTARPDVTYPTITECLVSAGVIDYNIIGIFLRPATVNVYTHVGELSFGGVDDSKFFGDIVYTPITETLPSAQYWGIDQRITYGDTEILDDGVGFIDSGSTFIQIAPYAYHRYQAATGAIFDQPTGLLRITLDRYNDLQELKFHMSGQTLSLTANAQIWPRSLNYKLRGGEINGIYLIIGNLGMAARPGLDFITGYTFMQRFYTALNDHFGVGFAPTAFTMAITN